MGPSQIHHFPCSMQLTYLSNRFQTVFSYIVSDNTWFIYKSKIISNIYFCQQNNLFDSLQIHLKICSITLISNISVSMFLNKITYILLFYFIKFWKNQCFSFHFSQVLSLNLKHNCLQRNFHTNI